MPHSIKIAGIAPPDLVTAPTEYRQQFWQLVVPIALRVKDQELARGLDAVGEPLRPITAKTRRDRRSAMTPSGKGSPTAPPLMPAYQKSRVRSLLAGRAFATHCELYWRYDPFSGASFDVILNYQRDKGRDVFGISDAGRRKIRIQSWAAWTRWKASGAAPAGERRAVPSAALKAGPQPRIAFQVARSALPNAGATAPRGIGTLGMRWLTRGVGTPTVREMNASRTRQGGMTGAALRSYWTAEIRGDNRKPPRGRAPVPRAPAPSKPRPFRANRVAMAKVREPRPDIFGPSKATVVLPRHLGQTRDQVERAAAWILGRAATLEQLAGLGGAMDDATITITSHKSLRGFEIYLKVEKPGFSALAILRRRFDDSSVIELPGVDARETGKGLGTLYIGRMAEFAVKLMVNRLQCKAVRSDTENGYYTWPRLGFDATIPSELATNLPESLKGATKLSDLMKNARGRQWWKKNGDSVDVTFDLAAGSISRKILDRYLKAKGFHP